MRIGWNMDCNNVSGSVWTVITALNNYHAENMEIINEQAVLERLQEDNKYYLKSKQSDIEG